MGYISPLARIQIQVTRHSHLHLLYCFLSPSTLAISLLLPFHSHIIVNISRCKLLLTCTYTTWNASKKAYHCSWDQNKTGSKVLHAYLPLLPPTPPFPHAFSILTILVFSELPTLPQCTEPLRMLFHLECSSLTLRWISFLWSLWLGHVPLLQQLNSLLHSICYSSFVISS